MNAVRFRFLPMWIAVLLLVAAAWFFYEPDLPPEVLQKKYANAHSAFMEIDGMPVHYRIEGNGTPLLLIHGTGAMLQTWDTWTAMLQNHYRIIRVDLPAFGLTGPRADRNYSDSMYVDFIHQFMSRLQTERFAIAGNSLGGLISWKYAARYPEQISHLVLVDPGGFYEKKERTRAPAFWLAREMPTLARWMAKMGTRFLTKGTLESVYEDDAKITPELLTRYVELNRRTGNRESFVDRMAMVSQNSDDALKPISCPTLILWGKQDQIIPVEEVVHFQTIPGAKTILYDGVGHCPQEEIPETTARDVLAFLKELP